MTAEHIDEKFVMKPVILVVDDKKTVDLIRLYLKKDGYRVLVAYDGRGAIDIARNGRPGLIILDLMLPKVDGLDVCRLLRSESNVYIIMLTAKTTEDDKLVGLDLGADDYVTKPFSPRELVARVRAVLRRGMAEEMSGPEQIFYGGLEVDFVRHEARVERRPEGYPSGIGYNHLGYSVFLHAQENTLKPFGSGENGGNEHFPLRSMT